MVVQTESPRQMVPWLRPADDITELYDLVERRLSVAPRREIGGWQSADAEPRHDERQQHRRPQHQRHLAQHQVVGYDRYKPCHVRGVQPHHQKAPGIDGARVERQQQAQQPVDGLGAVAAGEVA